MFIKLDAYLFLLFSYVIVVSYGLKILTFNNLNDVSEYFDNNERAMNSHYKTRTKNAQEHHSPARLLKKHNVYKNKILVKRIIPHSLKPSGLEYDYKYGTIYKPIVRIHKQKQLSPLEDGGNGVSFVIRKEPKLKHFKLNKVTDIDQELLTPFRTSKSDNKIKALEELQKAIRNIVSRTSRIKAYDKIIKVMNSIRTNTQFEKSGEDNDPLAPGKLILAEEREVATEKQNLGMPHYPAWNFWTYKKTIHSDPCPGAQVKMGNMCIWAPPH